MIRSTGTRILTLFFSTVWLALPGFAQATQAVARADAQSESRVSAEMVKGKLNPATSKPGDEIAVRLNEDVKSNGQVLLKKGSTIKGVVRKANRAENKGAAKANGTAQSSAQSMLELEWITPGVSGAASQQLNVALQSVVYTNPLYAHRQEESSSAPAFPSPAPAPARSGSGGLGVGAVGGVVGGVTSSVSSVGGGLGAQTAGSVGAVTQSQAQLARPMSITPVSAETSSALQNNFGVAGGPLFLVGSGQAISSAGTASSMNIFSRMSNDAVITSPSRDFEISSGAQMQLLVRGKE
jgi:hypothetical protein